MQRFASCFGKRQLGAWRLGGAPLQMARRTAVTFEPLPKTDTPKGYLDEPAGIPMERCEGKNFTMTEYPTRKHFYEIPLPELLEELSGHDVPGAIEAVNQTLNELEKEDKLDPQGKHDLEVYRKAFAEIGHVSSVEGMKKAMLDPSFEHAALDVSTEMTFNNRFRLMLYNLLVSGQEAGRPSTKANDLRSLYGELKKTATADRQPTDFRKPLPTDKYDSYGEVLAAFLSASLPTDSVGQNWTVLTQRNERVELFHWNDTVHLPFGHTEVDMRTWSEDQVRNVQLNFHYRTMVLNATTTHSVTHQTFMRVPPDWLLAFKRHRWPGVADANSTFMSPSDKMNWDEHLESLYTDVLPIRCDKSSDARAVPYPVRPNHPVVEWMKKDE